MSDSRRPDPGHPCEPFDSTDAIRTGVEVGTSKPLVMTFGTAVGAAMLGFEQALRNEPPAAVMAAEHMPARGQIGLDGEMLIDIAGLLDPSAVMSRDRPAGGEGSDGEG